MAPRRPLKVLLLLDLTRELPPNVELAELMREENWREEEQLLKALRAKGHDVKAFAVYDDLTPLYEELRNHRPDLVFNQCEAFAGDRAREAHLVAFLELMKIPYTGCTPLALQLCKDKGLSKKVLSFHGVRVPRFLVSPRTKPLRRLSELKFPVLIKPLDLEASEGISQVSFCEKEEEALERVKFLHEHLSVDAIVEEYIEGREIYVGVWGGKRPKILPARELFFNQVPEGEPRIATFKAKWDDDYRKRWGIRSGAARSLSPDLEERIARLCTQIYELLGLRGYARIDLRLTPENELVFLEANPNPSLAKGDDFAQAASSAGLSYEELIDGLVQLASS